MQPRRGFSLVEVLVATLVLAGLGLTVYQTMVSSLRGISVDRVTEAKRHLTLDLLEVFCQPYSAIESFYPPGAKSPAVREISVADAIRLVQVPAAQAARLEAILTHGGVTGLNLVWTRGVTVGAGDPGGALRLDKLWVHPIVAAGHQGPRVDAFRVFHVRGR